MAVDFTAGTFALQQSGLVDVILPFFLFFTLSYAILQTSHILNKKVNLVISISFAFLALLPHFIPGTLPFDPVNVLNAVLPDAVLILMVVLLFLIVVGIAGGKTGSPGYMPFIIFIISAIALGYSFMGAFLPEVFPGIFDWLKDPIVQTILIMVGVGGLIIWFVQSEKPTTTVTWEEKIKKWLGELGGGTPPAAPPAGGGGTHT